MYSPDAASQAKAKALCASCDYSAECLELALLNREDHGVWGGLNAVERKVLLRARKAT